MLIYACSTNPGKLAEFGLVLRESGPSDISIEPLPALRNIAAPEETGSTFEENAAVKAEYYSHFTSEMVLADDSGIAVEFLGGAPGVFSARYAGPNATDEQNNALLLNKMGNATNRAARFVCVITIAKAGDLIASASGTVEGEITRNPIGANGFGYDPLFFYPPFNCTFAQLTPEQKFSVSHRGNALRALLTRLSERDTG